MDSIPEKHRIMKTYTYIIGIDPDTNKSGIAVLNVSTRQITMASMPFFALFDYLYMFRKQHIDQFIVVIEGGWLVEKSNFHIKSGIKSEKVAKNVGSNHETGRKIVEMCQYLGIDHQIMHPLKKIWRGSQGKITHNELAHFTGITQSTCQDQRDAALICWEYAGLPIRIMPMKSQERKPALRESK